MKITAYKIVTPSGDFWATSYPMAVQTRQTFGGYIQEVVGTPPPIIDKKRVRV